MNNDIQSLPATATPDLPFFKKTAPASFSWPVKVPVPAEGRYFFAEFTGRFKYVPNDQVDAWLAPGGQPRRDAELAADVLLEVQGLKTDAGEDVASTPALVQRILQVDRAASAVVATFLAVIRGIAAEKN